MCNYALSMVSRRNIEDIRLAEKAWKLVVSGIALFMKEETECIFCYREFSCATIYSLN